MNKIIAVVIFSVIVVTWGITIGIQRVSQAEINECRKWQDESKVFPQWFASDWQIAQCKTYNIILPATK